MRTEEARAVVGKYLAALLLHVQRQLEGGRGAVVSVKTRHICGDDRRCKRVVRNHMMRLVEGGLATLHKRGVYLIKREVGEEVLKVLKKWIRQLKPQKISTSVIQKSLAERRNVAGRGALDSRWFESGYRES
jgi:hypothetical protein